MEEIRKLSWHVYTTFDGLISQFLHHSRPLRDESGDESVSEKIVVITGAAEGLGKSVATELARRNAYVIFACQYLEKAQAVIDQIERLYPQSKNRLIPIELDLSNLKSVEKCAKAIIRKFPHINILINNAGIALNKPTIERTKAGFEAHFVTNYLGHFLFTLLLVRHLKMGAPSRVVFVGSTAGRCADLDLDDLNWTRPGRSLGYGNTMPYQNSKMGIFLFSRELGRRLKGTGVTSYALCPGMCNTALVNEWKGLNGFIARSSVKLLGLSPEQGCETILYCAISKELAQVTGNNYRFRSSWKSLDRELSDEAAFKLWLIAENLANVQWAECF